VNYIFGQYYKSLKLKVMRQFSMRYVLLLLIIPFFGLNAFSQLYDWRGPDRTGIYNETGLLKQWPSNGPDLVWEIEDIGFGYSSATVTDDAVYITGRVEEDDVLTAITLDGKKMWDIVYGKAWIRNHTGTRGTPTYVDGKIYIVSGSGDIVCIDKSGKLVWTKNHFDIYGSSPLMFGISESPLFVDGKIITTPGGNKASIVAFNAETGAVVWEAESLGEGPQYVNPKLVEHGGRKIIVTNTNKHIIGVDADSGKILWKENYDNYLGVKKGRISKNHAITPLYRDGKLLIANGYNFIGLQFELSDDGSEIKLLWQNSDLEPHHGGMVLIGDYIYTSNHMSNSMGEWLCVDWNTGETLWKERWYNKGPIISADNMLYLYEEKSGHVGLAEVNPDGLDIVSEFQITRGDGPYWSHPVIKDGKLYIRHGSVLMVYSIKL
jgi:outer membrane protein assembly factor BamB